jgi:hypothetical protein
MHQAIRGVYQSAIELIYKVKKKALIYIGKEIDVVNCVRKKMNYS